MSQENIRVGDKVKVGDNSYSCNIATNGELVPSHFATQGDHIFVVKESKQYGYPCMLGFCPGEQERNDVKLWCEEHQYTRYTQLRFLRKIDPTTEEKVELLGQRGISLCYLAGVCRTHGLKLEQAINRLYDLQER